MSKNLTHEQIIPGAECSISADRDIGMDTVIRGLIGRDMIVNKITKAGLVEVYPEGQPKRRVSIPKANIIERIDRHPFQFIVYDAEDRRQLMEASRYLHNNRAIRRDPVLPMVNALSHLHLPELKDVVVLVSATPNTTILDLLDKQMKRILELQALLRKHGIRETGGL